MKEKTVNLLNEIDKLIDLLDRDGDLYENRINFYLSGQIGKGKFMDNMILPSVRKEVGKQAHKVSHLLQAYFN